jgi:hypothetical protein
MSVIGILAWKSVSTTEQLCRARLHERGVAKAYEHDRFRPMDVNDPSSRHPLREGSTAT